MQMIPSHPQPLLARIETHHQSKLNPTTTTNLFKPNNEARRSSFGQNRAKGSSSAPVDLRLAAQGSGEGGKQITTTKGSSESQFVFLLIFFCCCCWVSFLPFSPSLLLLLLLFPSLLLQNVSDPIGEEGKGLGGERQRCARARTRAWWRSGCGNRHNRWQGTRTNRRRTGPGAEQHREAELTPSSPRSPLLHQPDPEHLRRALSHRLPPPRF